MLRLFAAVSALIAACFALGAPVAAQDTRPVVGIAQMEDLTGGNQDENFIAMLETAIIGSGKFRIIERARLATLLEEQGLANGGVVTTNRPGQTGGFEGVDYLIYGTISSISASIFACAGSLQVFTIFPCFFFSEEFYKKIDCNNYIYAGKHLMCRLAAQYNRSRFRGNWCRS